LTSLRFISLLGLILLVVVSIIPGSVQIRTPLPKEVEHFIAYFAVAGVVALWRPALAQAASTVVLLTLLAGMMELVQEQIPGRTGSWLDVFTSALGAIGGAAAGLFAHRHDWPRRLEKRRRAWRRRSALTFRRRG
jgi:VanZ family protein